MIKNTLFLFAICAALFVFFLPSYLQMQDLHEKTSSYERQIHDLSRENEALLEEKRRLEEDPAYFERFAREKFGIIKDGEVIYKFVAPGATNSVVTNSQVVAEVKKPVQPAVKKVVKPPAKSATKKASSVKTAKPKVPVTNSQKSVQAE